MSLASISVAMSFWYLSMVALLKDDHVFDVCVRVKMELSAHLRLMGFEARSVC